MPTREQLINFFRGLFSASLFILNTIFWCLFLFPFALLKAGVPSIAFRKWCTKQIVRIAEKWIHFNSLNIQFTQRKTIWDLRLHTELDPNSSYLVCVNHQSWTDILALQHFLQGQIPFIRFFLKRELLYVPLLGLAWWALDYPFMKRHSKEYLEKYPEKRGEDLATTRKATEAFRNSKVSILNFLEGTRFTFKKHQAQKSPYRHLLLPKTGGLAFVLSAMGDQFDSLLDVTIVYPKGAVSFWQAFCGQMSHVVMDVRRVEIPARFLQGDYLNDPQFRADIQKWVTKLWEQKDALIERILAERLK